MLRRSVGLGLQHFPGQPNDRWTSRSRRTFVHAGIGARGVKTLCAFAKLSGAACIVVAGFAAVRVIASRIARISVAFPGVVGLAAVSRAAESAARAAQAVQSHAQRVASAKLSGLKPPDVATTRGGIDELKKVVLDSALQEVLDEFKNKVGS